MSVVVDYSKVTLDPANMAEIEGAVGDWFVHTLSKSLPNVAIVGDTEPADAELVVSVLEMQQGESTPLAAEVPSYLEARVTWFVKGEPTDEIQMAIEARKTGSGSRWDGTKRILIIGGGVTSQGRLRAASAEIAQSAAEYFTAARGS